MKHFIRSLFLMVVLALAPVTAGGEELSDLVRQASESISRGSLQEAEAKLEEALRRISNRLPLGVRKAVFVKGKSRGFGMYTPRGGSKFKTGEPLLLYVEPVHYGLREQGGVREIDLSTDLRIMEPDGKILFSKEGFARVGLRTRGWNREMYMNLTVTLTGAPQGRYILAIRLVDKVTGKTAAFTLPFSISGG